MPQLRVLKLEHSTGQHQQHQQVYVCIGLAAERCRSQSDAIPSNAPQGPVLLAPRPRIPAPDSHALALYAPVAAISAQKSSSTQDDIAKQIRAKFENLVRASPLPKVVHTSRFVRFLSSLSRQAFYCAAHGKLAVLIAGC